MKAQLEAAQGDARVKAIVITGTKGKFSGGFDITQLKARSEGKPVKNMADFNVVLNGLVEAGPKPTVAAIENLALGGGLEVAMACNARVATPGAQLGLPELQLGKEVRWSPFHSFIHSRFYIIPSFIHAA